MDLQGKSIGIAEGYVAGGDDVDELKTQVLAVVKRIPDFSHVESEDFQCVIALKQKTKGDPSNPAKLAHTIAECVFSRIVVRSVVQAQGANLPPYLLVFYPLYFKLKEEEQVKAIIHELKHVKPSKTGTIPHWGFGDSDVDATYQKFFKP